MWTQPRKSYRSPQRSTTQPRMSTAGLMTPARGHQQSTNGTKQCPLHFNECTHVCLTCRKSVCLRCALTYCQQHVIRVQTEALEELKEDMLRLQVNPRMQEIDVKLEQSRERQEYLQKKVLKLIESIEGHFDYMVDLLVKKKLQIIQYYDAQFQNYLQQHRNYDIDMEQRIRWLKKHTPESMSSLTTIQELDRLSGELKKAGTHDSKLEKKVTRMLMGKQKIRIDRLWSEQNLERALYQIEHIPFKMEDKAKGNKRSKRVTTQNATEHFNQTVAFVKSTSNSRFPSGRKPPKEH